MMESWIAVTDVAKAMGVEMPSDVAWSVGARVREMWRDEFGEYPVKMLRPKTSGGGSHCLAVYPRKWRQKIEKEIRKHQTFAASQGDLFGGLAHG